MISVCAFLPRYIFSIYREVTTKFRRSKQDATYTRRKGDRYRVDSWPSKHAVIVATVQRSFLCAINSYIQLELSRSIRACIHVQNDNMLQHLCGIETVNYMNFSSFSKKKRFANSSRFLILDVLSSIFNILRDWIFVLSGNFWNLKISSKKQVFFVADIQQFSRVEKKINTKLCICPICKSHICM